MDSSQTVAGPVDNGAESSDRKGADYKLILIAALALVVIGQGFLYNLSKQLVAEQTSLIQDQKAFIQKQTEQLAASDKQIAHEYGQAEHIASMMAECQDLLSKRQKRSDNN